MADVVSRNVIRARLEACDQRAELDLQLGQGDAMTPLVLDVLTKPSSEDREGLKSAARRLMQRALEFVRQWPWLRRIRFWHGGS
jgi:hypothetical protein